MTRAIHPIAFEIVEDAAATDIAALEAHIDAHNMRVTGIHDARLLSIMLRHADGALRAGLHGHTWGGTCQIKLLWVDEAERGRGLGSALVQAAEAEARRRGCFQIMLATHSFQAPAFYARHGFRQIAAILHNPIGHADLLMIKPLIA